MNAPPFGPGDEVTVYLRGPGESGPDGYSLPTATLVVQLGPDGLVVDDLAGQHVFLPWSSVQAVEFAPPPPVEGGGIDGRP